MLEFHDLFDLFFSNIKKLFYPAEWLSLDFSFSKTEILALMIIDRCEELIMSQLADYIKNPMSTATGIIDRLVKNGYIERERSDTDRRIVVIRLSDNGKELIGRLKNTLMDFLNLLYGSLTEEEQQMLIRILLKIVEIINKQNEQAELVSVETDKVRKIEIE